MSGGIFTERLCFSELPSTNTYLKENASMLQSGTVVTAERQTHGRGRLGNEWASDENQLALSVLLKNPENPMGLTVLSAVAAARAIETISGLSAEIKWTNDIVCREKKLCGILCESRKICDDLCVVCGFGINVGANDRFFEENALPYAASIYSLSGRLFSPAEVREAVLKELEKAIVGGFSSIFEEYRERCLTLGRDIKLIRDGNEICARAVGLEKDGALICENENGRFSVGAGEVSVRGLYGYV